MVENPFPMQGMRGRFLVGELRSLMLWRNEEPVQTKQKTKPQCHLKTLKNMCTRLEGGGNWIAGDFLGVWIMFFLEPVFAIQ